MRTPVLSLQLLPWTLLVRISVTFALHPFPKKESIRQSWFKQEHHVNRTTLLV